MELNSDQIRKKVESLQQLPTLPSVLQHILVLTRSPKTSASDVGEIISRDPALTGKILKLVNSAFYGFPRQIKTVTHAIVVLGFKQVRNVALTASVFDALKGKKGKDHLKVPALWEHALGCAVSARAVARSLGSAGLEDVFVGGLLHDIGKIVFDTFLHEYYSEVLEYQHKNEALLSVSERTVLGIGHERVGYWLSQKWNLPPSLSAAINFHHNPDAARTDRPMVMFVHFGDILARCLNIGNGGDNRVPQISPVVWKELKLNYTIVDKCMEEALESMKKVGEFLKLIN